MYTYLIRLMKQVTIRYVTMYQLPNENITRLATYFAWALVSDLANYNHKKENDVLNVLTETRCR